MYFVFSRSKRKHKIASRKTRNFELYCNDSQHHVNQHEYQILTNLHNFYLSLLSLFVDNIHYA